MDNRIAFVLGTLEIISGFHFLLELFSKLWSISKLISDDLWETEVT